MTRLPQMVIVSWNDSASSATLIYEEGRDHKPIVMHTAGWLMKRDKDGITVANERFTEEGQHRYRGWTFIPSGMVLRIETVRPSRRST